MTIKKRDYMKYQYIVWDWNGTVMDDVQIALDAVNDMLRVWNRPFISLDEYRRAMDTPIIHFYEQFFDLERTSFDWITKKFNSYYEEHQKEISLHDGVPEKLEHFRQNNCRQIVLSSSSTDIISGYAERYGIETYFEAILGADNLRSESKIERAVHYFRKQQVDLKQVILAGDTVHDFEVASALGVDCILLACGHQDRETLSACGCRVYDNIRDWKQI